MANGKQKILRVCKAKYQVSMAHTSKVLKSCFPFQFRFRKINYNSLNDSFGVSLSYYK